jgi:hypothetical protein
MFYADNLLKMVELILYLDRKNLHLIPVLNMIGRIK